MISYEGMKTELRILTRAELLEYIYTMRQEDFFGLVGQHFGSDPISEVSPGTVAVQVRSANVAGRLIFPFTSEAEGKEWRWELLADLSKKLGAGYLDQQIDDFIAQRIAQRTALNPKPPNELGRWSSENPWPMAAEAYGAIEIKERLGVTNDILLASMSNNSPLVSVQFTERRKYKKAGLVTWLFKGHLTGAMFDLFMRDIGQTAEGLSGIFDAVQAEPKSNRPPFYSQDFMLRIKNDMEVKFHGPHFDVDIARFEGFTAFSFVDCKFKLISSNAMGKSPLFDLPDEVKLP